jgi:lipopolysaccharide export system protein LptC
MQWRWEIILLLMAVVAFMGSNALDMGKFIFHAIGLH